MYMYIGHFYNKKTLKQLCSLHVHCNDMFRYLNAQRLFSIVLVILYQLLLHVTLLPHPYDRNEGSLDSGIQEIRVMFWSIKTKDFFKKIVFLESLLNMHPLEDIANTE